MNKNKDDFADVDVPILPVGKLRHVDMPRAVTSLTNEMLVPKEFIGGRAQGSIPCGTIYGPSPLRQIIRYLIAEDMLRRDAAKIFYMHHESLMTEGERKAFMEKYGVQIDPKKKPAPTKDGEKTATTDDPNVNVPKDPDKGTEPFEKEE